MKNFYPVLIFAFLAACGGKPTNKEVSTVEEPSNILENLTYSIDTVLIDSGETLFDLGDLSTFGKRNYFSLSQDGGFLYFFDRKRYILQEINLTALKLTNNYPFEEEGPNGVGRLVYTFRNLPNGTFFIRDLIGNVGFFSATGEKLAKLELNGQELLQDTHLEPHSIYVDLQVDWKRSKLYALPRNYKTGEIYFAVMDSLGQTGKILEIPELHRIFDFSVEMNLAGEGGMKVEQLHLQQLHDLVLISSTAGSSLYVYDPELDILFYKEFFQELSPREKEVELKKQVFGQQEYQAEMDKLHTQIDYWDFYWDELGQCYYRFASKGLPLANVDSPRKYEYFLFVYDKDLELKGETKLGNLSELPLGGFFKDGKLWSYVNVADELGFAVFTFDF